MAGKQKGNSVIELLPHEGIARVYLPTPDVSDLFAVIDIEDVDKVSGYRWHPARTSKKITASAYARRSGENEGGGTLLMHRVVTGIEPPGTVSHDDDNGLNNRKSNLIVNPGSPYNDRRHSRYRGVSRNRKTGAWIAKVGSFRIGEFSSEIEAARAYDQAVKRRMLNFPED